MQVEEILFFPRWKERDGEVHGWWGRPRTPRPGPWLPGSTSGPSGPEPPGGSACSWQLSPACRAAGVRNVPTQPSILLPAPAAAVLAPSTSLGSRTPLLYYRNAMDF